MSYRTIDEVLQWVGAVLIIGGHALNSLGAEYHKDFWNIASFTAGTALFLIWAVRVKNRPQATVNVISIAIMVVGLFKAIG